MIKKSHSILSGLVLVGVLVALSSCGQSAGVQPGTGTHPHSGSQPSSVRIEIDAPGYKQEKPIVTLTVASLVQQLYTTIYALPQMPAQRACTDELGPHYTLTFTEGSQTLVTARAMRDGCRPVAITGEAQDRHSTAEFWTQLDLAIYQGTPPAKPDLLAIAYTPNPTQAPQTARITSAETAQRLYNAILALPLHPYGSQCPTPGIPTYQFVFHTTQQVIPAVIDPTCKTISLDGAYRVRGGVYALNDQFTQLLAEIVSGAKLAPAQPDQLVLSITAIAKSSHQTTVGNMLLIGQLYLKVFTLQPTTTQPSCLGTDKAAGKGTWYDFSFSQWNLPILGFTAYEGSCLHVTRFVSGQTVQGDQALWDLVHQAASQ